MNSLFLARIIAILLPCACSPASVSQDSRSLTRESASHPSNYPCTFWHEGQQFVASLAWRNRWWLNYKCFHLKLLVVGYYELEDAREHQDYRYDLNIIFPDEDEGWAIEEFLVAVQEHLPDFLRNRIVCGDDDLPLGSTRYDAIDRVIENSFKNLVIVSNASVNDAIFLMTLQMAVAHMNDVQLENIVMVFREDIPDNQLPYLVRLFLSKNKPYFQWSEERYQQMLFWEGLAKTLSRNKKMNGLLPL
ncbi:toll-like receptor 13 [Diadema antillarum]|uniref:toll-like receptor 13 n=1 Tax=Diadema antillarum TaxID=105358 RepID=UPI003A88CDA3